MLNLPRASWLLLALACALHGVLGASLGLSVDEAHYALYAAHPDWSYFDHPPLVGWAQWPLVAVHAPTWVLRLLPELLWLGTALLVHGLAERLQAGAQPLAFGRAGFWAVLVLAFAPLLHVLGIGLLPDTLLVFWTVAVMWLTLDLMDVAAVRRPMPWLLLGLLLGLAGLSKYTAIFVALAVALCLLQAHGARLLRNLWPWLAVVIAVVLVLPVVYWNHTNHWISFTYQAKHGAGGGWQATQVLQFLVVQLLVFGPLFRWGLAGRAGCAVSTGASAGVWPLAVVGLGWRAPWSSTCAAACSVVLCRSICGAGRVGRRRHQPAALDGSGVGGAGANGRHWAGPQCAGWAQAPDCSVSGYAGRG